MEVLNVRELPKNKIPEPKIGKNLLGKVITYCWSADGEKNRFEKYTFENTILKSIL